MLSARKEWGGDHIITSIVEHVAVIETCKYLEDQGFKVTYLPVDSTGQISVDELIAAVTPTTVMVSLMHSNNETGTFHPIKETVTALRKQGAVHPVLVHT